jgi:hypothetical protein
VFLSYQHAFNPEVQKYRKILVPYTLIIKKIPLKYFSFLLSPQVSNARSKIPWG